MCNFKVFLSSVTNVTHLYKMGDKSGFYLERYRPKKLIGVKNMVLCFFAYIHSIDPLLSKYAYSLAETIIKVVKRHHFITVLS